MAAIAALMLLLMQSADPSKTKRGERLAEVMRIGATLAPPKSHEPYLRAHEELRGWYTSDTMRRWVKDDFNVRFEHAQSLGARLSGEHVDTNWTQEEDALIQAWLAENEVCLKLVGDAVASNRVYFPLKKGETNDLMEARALHILHRRLIDLLSAATAAAAREKNWSRVWTLVEQQVRIARHEYQQPTIIQQFRASETEQLVASRAIDLLHAGAPVSDGLEHRWVDAVSQGTCPAETIAKVEDLFAFDSFEIALAWATTGKPEPAMAVFVEHVSNMQALLVTPQSALADDGPDAVRKALQKTSLEKLWTTYHRIRDVRDEFAKRPFHLAWPIREEMKSQCAALLKEEPAVGALMVEFGLMGMAPDSIFAARARRLTQRNALRSILQLRAEFDRNGRYPRSLPSIPARPPSTTDDENAAGLDVFSGKPLIYRVSDDGKSFTLYSVGWNLVDDGGKLPTPPPESATPLERTADPDGDIVFWPPTTR